MIFSYDHYCLNCQGTGCSKKRSPQHYLNCGENCKSCLILDKSLIPQNNILCSECFNKCKSCKGIGYLEWINFIVKN